MLLIPWVSKVVEFDAAEIDDDEDDDDGDG